MEIRNRFNNSVIHSNSECTNIKELVEDAVRKGINLNGADLNGASLYGASLRDADLHGADLRYAYLSHADLSGADLHGADLSGADLSGAYLRGADLIGVDLICADLRDADLRGANLHGADLSDIQKARLSIVPEEGAFIAFKKIKGHLITLEIPVDAKRLNSFSSRKCRVSKALVTKIVNIDTGEEVNSIKGGHDKDFIYTKNELAIPDGFDDRLWVECAQGIHCFITKQEAIEY